MTNYLYAASYFSAAGGFYVLSGAAEGMTSPRIMISFIFLAAFLHVVIIIFQFVRTVFGAKTRTSYDAVPILLSVPLILVASKMGTDIDNARIQQSMGLGDVLLADIREFKQQEGRCPVGLDELTSKGIEIPSPALKMSEYKYYITNSGNCVVYFNSVLFMQCSKGLENKEWYCDD